MMETGAFCGRADGSAAGCREQRLVIEVGAAGAGYDRAADRIDPDLAAKMRSVSMYLFDHCLPPPAIALVRKYIFRSINLPSTPPKRQNDVVKLR